MENTEIFNGKRNERNHEEEDKRKIIEDHLNYQEISEAIAKINTIMEFILEKKKRFSEILANTNTI